jgi:hypothetical protein
MMRFHASSPKTRKGHAMLLRTVGAIACLALALAGCGAQRNAQQAAQAMHGGYGSGDFAGNWTCNWTNGKYSMVDSATIRSDGTAVGNGTVYGHTTPTYETSWSYAPKGPTSGTMSVNNLAFAPPHYSETGSVNWLGPNRYTQVTLTDNPNVKAIGSRMDCTRRP